MRLKLTILALIAALIVPGINCMAQKVQNVIYLIGDGMGLGAVSSLVLSEKEATGFELGCPVIGLNETVSANNYSTDSPAGGTALATGVRTRNGFLGVGPDSLPLTSVLKKAQAYGKKTGIVVNTVLTEATPGAFYAGVTTRKETYKIASQFVESDVDVAVGSGLEPFTKRPDSLDLTKSLIEKGYDVYLTWPEVALSKSDKYVGILPWNSIHRRNAAKKVEAGAANGDEVCFAARMAAHNDPAEAEVAELDPTQYLTLAVEKVLSSLEKNAPNGFFLMIESAIIDGYGHNNDSDGLIEEMREFDRTLKFLVKYVNEHPNTLLVITADHETGGVNVGYMKHEVGEEPPVTATFSTKGHTGTLVPIFAYGPGAEAFGRIMQNREIPLTIDALMK